MSRQSVDSVVRRIAADDFRRHMRIVSIPKPELIDTDAERRLAARNYCCKLEAVKTPSFNHERAAFLCPVCGDNVLLLHRELCSFRRMPLTENVYDHLAFSCNHCKSIFEFDPAFVDCVFRKDRLTPYELIMRGHFISDMSELKKCECIPTRQFIETEVAIGVAVGVLLSLIILGLMSLVCTTTTIQGVAIIVAFMIAGGLAASANFWRRKKYCKTLEEPLHKTKAVPK